MAPTLWGDTDLTLFYKDLGKAIKKFNAFPGEEKAYDQASWKKRGNHEGSNRLTFDEETEWVSNLAFLVAASEGAGNVSAVFVEERWAEMTLKSYAAANDPIPPQVRDMIRSVLNALTECAHMKIGRRDCAEKLLDIIVPVHASRIHSRLESPQWVPPDHLRGKVKRTPFIPKLLTIIQKTKFPKRRDSPSDEIKTLKESIQQLSDTYNELSSLPKFSVTGTNETDLLKKIAKQSNTVTIALGRRTLERALEERYPQLVHKEGVGKLAKQIDKLGNYWGACKSLSCLARSIRTNFQQFIFEALDPYPRTKIAGTKRTVHAEIRLLVYMRLNQVRSQPRSIGVSKAACYLCDKFITNHGKYFVSGTHGILTDQWRFPDISELHPKPGRKTAIRFKAVLQSLRIDLDRLLVMQQPAAMKSRLQPMQSRIFDSCQPLATLSDNSLIKVVRDDIGNVRHDLVQVESHESIPRQDSGHQSGLPASIPQNPSLMTKQDDAVIREEANGIADVINEPTEIPAFENDPQMGDPVPLTDSSRTSLESAPSTVQFTPSTTTESSQVITKKTPARFAISSLCLDVGMNDDDVPEHETTARAQCLLNRGDIAALLDGHCQKQVIDRRGLLPGEECILPVPESDSGRAIHLLLGKGSNEAIYLELKVHKVAGPPA